MKLQGAVIKEQGITFAVVIVKKQVVDSTAGSRDAISNFTRCFPGMPLVLMAQDGRGIPTYRGRKDIINFLSNTPLSAIPWKEYSIN